jgi:hypothetical protein
VQGFLRAVRPQVRLVSDSVLSAKLENGSRIISLPGDGDSIRGFSAVDLLIEDEAAFVSDALYYAVRPMLAVSGGRIALLSTPHGRIGHFFREWTEGGDDWERVKITAHEVPRISFEFLERERITIGNWWYSQEYLGEFRDTDEQLFSTSSISAAIDRELVPLELSF